MPPPESGDGTGDASAVADASAPAPDSSPPSPVDGGGDRSDASITDGARSDVVARADAGAEDAPYSLIDVASLPDVLGLDAYAPCDILNCSSGCCLGDGTCVVPGTAPTACGGSGNACVDCTKTSQTCNPGTYACQ